MKKNILLTGVLIFTCQFIQAQTKERPKEAWVFRSVLDKKARVITVALNKDLYVAYDGNNGGIFKIWKEGIIFSGTIWDTKHGPQPVSKGQAYTVAADEPAWTLTKDGKDIKTTVQFKGYHWKDNSVTFLYELSAEDGTKVSVEETPEYVVRTSDKTMGLERKFTTGPLPYGMSVVAFVQYNKLITKEDLVTDGSLKITSRNEQYLDWGTIYDVKARLTLKTGTTTLTTYHSPKVIL